MTYVTVAIAAFVGVWQENPKETEAEALFRKFEEKITKAKTVQYKAKIRMEKNKDVADVVFEAALKEGNKARLHSEGEIQGKPSKLTAVCDGEKLHVDISPGESSVKEAGKELAASLRTVLARASAGTQTRMLGKRWDVPVKDVFTMSDLKLGADEKVGDRTAKVLSGVVTPKGEGPAELKLWIDAETLVALKRVLKAARGPTTTETYTDWVFDAEIKDEVFALPKEK